MRRINKGKFHRLLELVVLRVRGLDHVIGWDFLNLGANLGVHVHSGKVVDVVHVATNKLWECNASAREALLDVALGSWAPLANLALALLCLGARARLAPLIVEVSILYVHV